MKPCVAIPIFDHGATIASVVEALAPLGLPCLIVDDGSSRPTQERLAELTRQHVWVRMERHEHNRGRGAALRTAYRRAHSEGFSHVVQLDADGQHDARDVPRFLEAAQRDPRALVLGEPIFDRSAPAIRLYGRELSKAIVRLQTLSGAVHDPLCGFRCIPLRPTVALLDATRFGSRMEFDPELVVRLVRAGVPVVNVPTAVDYPLGGISHFRMVEDNVRIAWAYTRLAADLVLRGARS
ncbi:MAG: glycosyltransferase family 2 protein [Deltaproteobacteria bacterium]|nr:glycosyltransferase family 2 protein [Deltaproteobacteria bacterium]